MPLFPVNRSVFSNNQNDTLSTISEVEIVQPVHSDPSQSNKSVAANPVLHPVQDGEQPIDIHVLLNDRVITKIFTPVTVINQPIPLASTRNGNLFSDRFDTNLLWYLPTFSLLSEADTGFSFVATQSDLLDYEGNPFYVTNFKFTIHKETPNDAVTAKAGNTSINIKEIPLDTLQLTLILIYNDDRGIEAQTSYPGTIQATNNGNYEVHFDNIEGNHVVILYQNLKVTGSVHVTLSSTYLAWVQGGTPIYVPRSTPMFFLDNRSSIADGVSNEFPVKESDVVQFNTFPLHQSLDQQRHIPIEGFNETDTFYEVLNLEKKYNGNEYQLSYKLRSNGGERIIIDANDLKNLNGHPTEFSELKTIELSKYPSIRSLYIGSLSRIIIIIPRAYGIVRKAIICSAYCFASVDSTPSDPDINKFEFQFEITPDIDPVDFIMLLKEIQHNNDLKTYTLRFTANLSSKFPSILNSAFSTDTSFAPSITPQNFIITTTITDKPGQSAVASVNLFIQQLCHAPQACVLGVLNLELDDNFPDAVTTPVTLSLPKAISNDGISWSVDSDTQVIKLTNSTAFNFMLERYILCSDQEVGDPVTVNIPIATGESASFPLPQNFNLLSMGLDYGEQSNGLVDRTSIAKYMEIRTQDVQNVQYFIGVNSSQIRYADFGIEQIDIQVILNTLSSVNVPQFSVMKLNTAGGTKTMLPLQFAVTSLLATVIFSIKFLDTSKPVVVITKQNDFISNPILDLTDSDVSDLLKG